VKFVAARLFLINLMRKIIYSFTICILAIALLGCSSNENTPHSKHVILFGFDAMGSYGFQRAHTPYMNKMIEEGAVTMNARSVRETSSSQNWMSMVSGTCIEQHGVYDNSWEPYNAPIEPTVKNAKGLFPTIFDHLFEQRPDAKVYAYYQWTGQDRMYDLSHVTKRVTGMTDDEILDGAMQAYLDDQPDFLFVSLNITDEMGHEYGHESDEYLNAISHLDEKVGKFVEELKSRNLLDDVTIIITADHGGIRYGHGGDTPQELLIPIIMYGGKVTKGKVMEHGYMIYDVGATVAGLLNIKLPRECYGKFISEAYEPATGKEYVPVPFIRVSQDGTEVSMTADAEGCSIRYTIDGSEPDANSNEYAGPFKIDNSCVVKAAAFRNGQKGFTGDRTIYLASSAGEPKVAYKYFDDWHGTSLPDFGKIGRAAKEGFINDINLDALGIENKDHFAVQFSTNLNVPENGTYFFNLLSDDGSALYIDGEKVLDNDGSHSAASVTNSVRLSAGIHSLRVDFFDDTYGQMLSLSWRNADDRSFKPVLNTDLTR
jgi:hypothetical protein